MEIKSADTIELQQQILRAARCFPCDINAEYVKEEGFWIIIIASIYGGRIEYQFRPMAGGTCFVEYFTPDNKMRLDVAGCFGEGFLEEELKKRLDKTALEAIRRSKGGEAEEVTKTRVRVMTELEDQKTSILKKTRIYKRKFLVYKVLFYVAVSFALLEFIILITKIIRLCQ